MCLSFLYHEVLQNCGRVKSLPQSTVTFVHFYVYIRSVGSGSLPAVRCGPTPTGLTGAVASLLTLTLRVVIVINELHEWDAFCVLFYLIKVIGSDWFTGYFFLFVFQKYLLCFVHCASNKQRCRATKYVLVFCLFIKINFKQLFVNISLFMFRILKTTFTLDDLNSSFL